MVLDDKGFSVTAQKLDGLVTLLRTDLASLGESVRSVSEALAKSSAGVRSHNETMGEGEKALRGFYREQKLQDRTVRESQSALLGFTIGMSALISGVDGGSEGVKKFEKVVLTSITAMQAAEFSAAGLGIAGKGLGGTLGSVAGFLEKNAGWIGVIVGLGAGLITFFRDTNKEATKAADEGLKNFSEALKKIAPSDIIKTGENIDKKIISLQNKIKNLGKSEVYNGSYEIKVLSPDDEKEKKKLEKRIEILQDIRKQYDLQIETAKTLKEIEAEQNIVLANHKSRIEEINLELENNNKQLQTGKALDNEKVLTQKELRTIADSNVKLTNEKKKLTQSTKDIEEEAKKQAEERQKKEEERLKNLREMNASMVSLDEYVKQAAEFDGNLLKSKKMTTEEYVAQLRIMQEQVGVGEIFTDLEIKINDALKQQTDEVKKKADEEKSSREHATEISVAQYNLGEKTRSQALAELRAQLEATTNEEERLKIKAKIRKLEDEELDQYARIAELLSQAFTKDPDTFIAKLSQALQIAIQIARYLKATEDVGTSTLDSLEGGLGIIGSIIGLFAKTYAPSSGVPSQPMSQPSQGLSMSWASASIRHSSDVLQSLSRSTARSAGPSESNGLMLEIRALRTDIRNNPPTVELHNIVTMEKALETKMPGYEKYKKRKFE